MSLVKKMSAELDCKNIDEECKTKSDIEKTDFGSGYFIFNVDKKELYNFLQNNMPKDCVHDSFDEFIQNLEVYTCEDDDLDETGLRYVACKGVVVDMADDFLYVQTSSKIKSSTELLVAYERFMASKFPEFKQNYIKRIVSRKRHYMNYYAEECRRAYKIYKDNMNALNKSYREIFDEDCPVFRK